MTEEYKNLLIEGKIIIVSACLCGVKCRFDGDDNFRKKVADLVRSRLAIPICPEQLGGLPTPRTNPERIGNKVIDSNGKDITKEYYTGAKEGLRIARLIKADLAILKARSPSCGVGQIYDGTFSKTLIQGNGVFAEECINNGIQVYSEEDIFGKK